MTLIYLPEVPRDTVTTIHYKANRDRYVNSILRSNTDIGTVLEEMYPEKIKKSGTHYKFITAQQPDSIPSLEIYYIPSTLSNLLTSKEIQRFKELRSSYYVTNDITIRRGNLFKAVFNIKARVYQNISIDDKVGEILDNYQDIFDFDLEEKKGSIIALLNKIPNVKQITDLFITYTSEVGDVLDWEKDIKPNLSNSYFSISYLVNSII